MSPEPWIVAQDGEAYDVGAGSTLRGEYKGSRISEDGYELHDMTLDGQYGSTVLYGGPDMPLKECAKGEIVNLRYLGSYPNVFGISVYRWQLWRENAKRG